MDQIVGEHICRPQDFDPRDYKIAGGYQVGDKVISTINFKGSNGSIAIGDEGVVKGPSNNRQAAGWKERVNCDFPGFGGLTIHVSSICRPQDFGGAE